jgi:hypothetical protein
MRCKARLHQPDQRTHGARANALAPDHNRGMTATNSGNDNNNTMLHDLELLWHDAEVRTVRVDGDTAVIALSAAPLRWRDTADAGPWVEGYGAGLVVELWGLAEFPAPAELAGALGRVSRGELRVGGERRLLGLPLDVSGDGAGGGPQALTLSLDFSNGTALLLRAQRVRCLPPEGLQPRPSYAC